MGRDRAAARDGKAMISAELTLPLYQRRLHLGIGKRKWRRRKPIEKQKGGKTPGSELTAGPSAGHVGGDKAKAVLATFRKIPESNIDCFNLRRSSAPTGVRRARVGTAVKSNSVLRKCRYSSFRRAGMAEGGSGTALRGHRGAGAAGRPRAMAMCNSRGLRATATPGLQPTAPLVTLGTPLR